MTTPAYPSVTDDLLVAIEYDARSAPSYAFDRLMIGAEDLAAMAAELRNLRAENAELARDAGRLDWLDQQCEAYGFEGVHEGNRWLMDGPFATVRQAIDISMEQTK